MVCKGFFTSWATPAAKVPTDSSFAAWINCSWVVCNSSLAAFNFCKAAFKAASLWDNSA